MWVTCYADASFQRKQGGAWAVWLRSSAGRIVRRGSCPAYVKDSVSAELAAIFAGIHLAHRSWPSTTGILVRSDCVAALAAADPDAQLHSAPAIRRLQQRIRELLKTEGIAVALRWVKGHQRANNSGAWLNNQVDRLARAKRRASRDLAALRGGTDAQPPRSLP